MKNPPSGGFFVSDCHVWDGLPAAIGCRCFRPGLVDGEGTAAVLRGLASLRRCREGVGRGSRASGKSERIVRAQFGPAGRGRQCRTAVSHVGRVITLHELRLFQQACRTGRTTRLRSEEHTSELQSLMRISNAVFCLQKTNKNKRTTI